MKKKFFSSCEIKTKQINFGFFTKNINFAFKNYKYLNKNLHSNNNNNTKKKIKEIQKLINLDKNNLKMVSQIHSNKVILIDNSNFENKFEADGIITQEKTISIGILTADCCPIFLFDNDSSFICCLHVGWKGCYLNIIKNATKKIIKIQPNFKKINAIIGPCLNKKNFEVSLDFKNLFLKKKPNYKKYFINNNNLLFNMRKLIEYQLKEFGIHNIEHIDYDTYSNKNLFFSHRRSTHLKELPAGRMINIIGFNK